MKKSELNQFTAVLQPIDGWYTALTRGEKRQLIVTDAKYAARFTFRTQDEGAVYYRLEDLKAQSTLLGNARKGPQENNLTVLDQAIFQFELKKVKNLSDTHLTSQFPNGAALDPGTVVVSGIKCMETAGQSLQCLDSA